ncbi:phosphoenolpyruvate--protein phosphotransferase [Chryseolinea lacunae]|uniref:Phosphoenolpyruvate-protein phosphotransferase n=1 Tax=Chryseolinea lacunae TaxID=2801331 RepID=A0ABS1KKU1_9BACT|nr:phosphoenolpyruvate--protein phosphotransferase [Chryseolinea lacunae]MBL0739842.1 phosphoenolpyruvate--protein phosphotransferase [Chryseolinea lacunae]
MEKGPYNTGGEIRGVVASPGIAIGRAHVLRKRDAVSTGILLKDESEVLRAIEKFELAVQASVEEVKSLKRQRGLSNEEVDILETHIEFLTDPQIKADVFREITKNKKNVIDSVIDVIHKTVDMFRNMDDDYLRTRAADIQDIGDRILKNLLHTGNNEQTFPPNTILLAEDISPSDAIAFDMSRIIGFATRVGGKTSHTAILAKSKNIPAVVGCGTALDIIETEDVVIVDGTTGIVIVNPDEIRLEEYKARKEACDAEHKFLSSLKDIPAITPDGVAITLLANIANADDMDDALTYRAAGAGLFRTELLFMNRTAFPTEDEQLEFYKKTALKAKGKPVTVRTIDIGGDKPLDYFTFPKEDNPFLGYRAIRISLDRQDIFITQLRAILRASVFGTLKIMFPMISSLQELRQAKEILERAKAQLSDEGIEFDKTIPVGMMIEVPSAAVMADLLAKEVDFFSIGTNDLCQYTLAVDRGNEKVKALYDPFNPAVLRLIGYVIEQAHKQKIGVSLCGELASDPQATLVLMGMGLREFSMSAASIPAIKNVIIHNAFSKATEICENVMAMDNSKTIIDYLQTQK